MTREEAIAACVASSGWGRAPCAEYVADRMVDGAFCDGTIVLEEGGARCVPRELVDRVREARAAAPIVVESAPTEAPSSWAAVAIVALGVAAVLYVGLRR